jgi:hypothetical protein
MAWHCIDEKSLAKMELSLRSVLEQRGNSPLGIKTEETVSLILENTEFSLS